MISFCRPASGPVMSIGHQVYRNSGKKIGGGREKTFGPEYFLYLDVSWQVAVLSILHWLVRANPENG